MMQLLSAGKRRPEAARKAPKSGEKERRERRERGGGERGLEGGLLY
jgi:hypothetical protein